MRGGRHRQRTTPARRGAEDARHEPRGAGGSGCLRRYRRHDLSGPSPRGAAAAAGRRTAARSDGGRGPCTAGARRRALTAKVAEAIVRTEARPIGSAGALLGLGMGGLFDGIVLGELFQLHHVLPGRPPAVTEFWDGLLQVPAWLAVAGGVALLFRAARRRDVPWSGRILCGAMLFGWGLFNVLEGVVGHHLLRLHHVVDGAPGAWDWVFLAVSGVLMALGWSLTRAPVRRVAALVVLPIETRLSRRA